MQETPRHREFHHPYQPYQIQLDFMNAVYDTIEDGCIGIFESPTGTGKSLSLICGSLTWLRDHKTRNLNDTRLDDETEDEEPAWVREHAMDERKQRLLRDRLDLEERLANIRERERKEKAFYERGGRTRKKQRVEVALEGKQDVDEAQFLVDDYESDEERVGKSSGSSLGLEGLSPAIQTLLKKVGHSIGTVTDRTDLELPDELKIFYCSRTHSQLTQFVNELRRVHFPSSIQSEITQVEEVVKHLSLGSRKNLCINEKVLKLGNVTAINERCLELQRSADSTCLFLPKKEDQVLVREFRDSVLAQIRDIEDLASLGKKMNICPYYAARSTIKPSEIITLPYPLLLQKSAREALGLSLKGHIVIIDEAHNLIDTITAINSVIVTLPQLKKSHTQLGIYITKFQHKLKGKNKAYILQLIKVLDSLATYLENLNAGEGSVEVGDLLAAKGIDQVNIFKLHRYLSESKLARKVEGYLDNEGRKKNDTKRNISDGVSVPTLIHLQSFLLPLTNPSGEGKIFHGLSENKEAYFKYMLLDPAFHFRSIVEEARAVLFAGGTMEPMDDFRTHLFPYLPQERIRTLSCGHVIPKEHLLAWSIAKGPGGWDLDFSFEKRNDNGMIEDLGKAIVNLCLVIPHGVVCFFPSYAYMELVISQWKANAGGTATSTWERLQQRKVVFIESKDTSSVEEVLGEYGQAIDSGKGGLLLSVVGGKMSEGINFSDNLGRGVIMVGLPFPNSQSTEWRAKLAHVEKVAAGNYTSTTSEAKLRQEEYAKEAARQFYQNACMRAVNQSIGRAIRHRQDYAVIALLDRRYSQPRITNKFPKWIREAVADATKTPFIQIMRNTAVFFKEKTD